MKIPIFQLINLGLILVLLVFFIRYIWDLFFTKGYSPVEWEFAKKTDRISKRLLNLEKNYPDKVRFFTWWLQIERLKSDGVPGCFAELGVYKGESARILHFMDPERKFHLFDTFKGMPMVDLLPERGEAAIYTPDRFADTDLAEVLLRISDNGNIFIYPGYFPETAANVQYEKFALVNIDVDLYNPTRAALDFFYPRLSPGGVIMVHDHNYKWEGIKKAINEFVGNIPEGMVLLPDMEGTCLIIRNK
jgi:O-methyltransferase